MADTERTRAQLLALYADNTSGNIGAQDGRDFIVSNIPEERKGTGDFWQQPLPEIMTTDRTTRGAYYYSQVMLSACSFGDCLYLTTSNTWGTADTVASARTCVLGIATDSFAAADSTATILRRGAIYLSGYSARFSGFIARPLYLGSGESGRFSVTINTNSNKIIGHVMPTGIQSTVATKFFFDPDFSIVGI